MHNKETPREPLGVSVSPRPCNSLQGIEDVEDLHEVGHGLILGEEGGVLHAGVGVEDQGRLGPGLEERPLRQVTAVGVAGFGEVGPGEDHLFLETVAVGVVLRIARQADEVKTGLIVDMPEHEGQFPAMRRAPILTGLLRQVDRITDAVQIGARHLSLRGGDIHGLNAEGVVIAHG